MFFCLSVAGALWGKKLPYNPKLITTIILLILIPVLGYGMWGSIALYPFLFFSFLTVLSVFIDKPQNFSKSQKFHIASIALVAITTIAFFGLREKFNPTPRTPIEMILKWGGTHSGRVALVELKRAEPESTDDYRRLLKELDGFYVGQVAKRLAIIGDLKTDVPLLINAYERSLKDQWGSPENIEAALKILSGLPLPSKTTPAEWRKQWKENND